MIIVRFLLAFLLGIHALAHLVGFAWPWWVMEPLPYGDLTEPGPQFIDMSSMSVLSVVWLATAIGFGLGALTRLLGMRSWRDVTAAAAVASLVLSIACWPGSLFGVPINLTILGLLRAHHDAR